MRKAAVIVVAAAVIAAAGVLTLARLSDEGTPDESVGDDAGSPLGAEWVAYVRTFGSSFLNVSASPGDDPALVNLSFVTVDAAGEERRWEETVRRDSRVVVESTSGLAGLGSPYFDPAVGDATWLFLPDGVAEGDRVRVMDRVLTVTMGEDAPESIDGSWALCRDEGCYHYDRESGAYVHWSSDQEPGWTLIESADPGLTQRFGLMAAAEE